MTNIKLVTVKTKGFDNYTSWFENECLKGFVVQTEKLKDIPKEMATSFMVMLDYNIENEIFEFNEIEELSEHVAESVISGIKKEIDDALSEHEQKLEKIVDEIKSTESTLECIAILKRLIS